jgi:rhodanese-related sulfurtransferase
MTALPTIPPHRAAESMREDAVLIDIREADEHARERIQVINQGFGPTKPARSSADS